LGERSRRHLHAGNCSVVADLLTFRVVDDVQHLGWHAEARTTGLYDRRRKKVTRNIVERISI